MFKHTPGFDVAARGYSPSDLTGVTYEAGHPVYAELKSQVNRDVLDWLDKYFGPVG